MYVIAADGSGDFLNMAQAAQALPMDEPAILVYREGEREESAVFEHKGLLLIGEDRDRTKVHGSVSLTGEGAEARNITFLGSAECTYMRNCVLGGEMVDTSPEHKRKTFLLGDGLASEGMYDMRLPGCSVKRYITEKRFNYAELCFLAGDDVIYYLSDIDCSEDIGDLTDPWLVYPRYLAMLHNAVLESSATLRFCMDTTRKDEHARAARAFCIARNIPCVNKEERL